MRHLFALLLGVALLPQPAPAQDINFGDDSGSYPRDGECDDRRFFGQAMATSLNRENIGKDATDCRTAFESGRAKLWDGVKAQAATICTAIDFGDDSSEYANDDECDDYRFEGMGADEVQLSEDIGKDASDCRRLCEFGQISLRDY